MVDVVVPLGIVEDGAAGRIASQQTGAGLLVLEHEVNMPIGRDGAPHGSRELVQNVLLAPVDDLVDGVQAQAFDLILLEPYSALWIAKSRTARAP